MAEENTAGTTVRIHGSISEIDAEAWDALVGEGSPFLEWAWLNALEETGCATPDEGWVPRHVTVWRGEKLVAGAPTWIKLHSMGEFVYDWSWASAARDMGEDYYPKLVVGVPFTPVTGRRLLTLPGEQASELRELLVAGLHELARLTECAGIHVLFLPEEEARQLEGLGAQTRLQFQFHWSNRGYTDFEGYLANFRSKRRNQIRRERRRLEEDGVRLQVLRGAQVEPEHLEAMHSFYRTTCWRFGGAPYLKPELWEVMRERLGPRLHLVLAYDGDRPIAGAFNVHKGNRLYGRYWGAAEQRRFLHFEVCYYQPIEDSVNTGVQVFEPGHGGGHKYPRGFEPALCYSSHWLRTPRMARAVADFLERERRAVMERVVGLEAASPLKE